ncbi:MAG: DUF2309 domain-containing protein [Gemmataceae bacterium]|nr:DUF2309 domain-containing protein [Gemmataceae bacterium]MDW8266112.1 DUF2309 domain-containing protein [Gemmataceae bacterium]
MVRSSAGQRPEAAERGAEVVGLAKADTGRYAALDALLTEVTDSIAPLWPLADFVAVNPLLGMTRRHFLEARQQLRHLRDVETLMPWEYFHELLDRGEVSREDIGAALHECRQAGLHDRATLTADRILWWARTGGAGADRGSADRRCWTVAELIDQETGTDWSHAIRHEVSRHCAAHFDLGQAAWPSPWRGLPLYTAWCRIARVDRRLEKLGVRRFCNFVARLPESPRAAIHLLLTESLQVPLDGWRNLLLCELGTVSGWGSYLRRRSQEAGPSSADEDDLVGLLAIRLAYDAGLVAGGQASARVVVALRAGSVADIAPISDATWARYVLQVASEIAYRRRLLGRLVARPTGPARSAVRKKVQMVFCIDTRSEIIRRHLETISEAIETFGFAGFFGLPFEWVPFGETAGSAQCPALLQPAFRVAEELRDVHPAARMRALQRRRGRRLFRRVWKSFQTSAASCFSFVETMGPTFLLNLLADSLRLWGRRDPRFDGVARQHRHRLKPAWATTDGEQLELGTRIDLADRLLRQVGLTSGLAPVVVFCGHESETVNNPYRAGLNCGACGGHSGEANARLAAALLNDPAVRDGLRQRGLDLPSDTWFLPAVHNTTTDEIRFTDLDLLPTSHVGVFGELRDWARRAGERARAERAGRHGRHGPSSARLAFRRGRDWSEVRPEWGLAGNAAFIAAPRSRTYGLALDGRAFLHSYDYRDDGDGRTLELILTAPVVVASWINLQYYASTVDNAAFGSGNKVLHNVVGLLGVWEGNGGDLRIGLPWQSVHDGQVYQHPPLRLQVLVEAPRSLVSAVLGRQPAIRQLACGGWLTLLALEHDQVYRLADDGRWAEELPCRHAA